MKIKKQFLLFLEEYIFKSLEAGSLKIFKVFFDRENIYNIIYLVISAVALKNDLLYSILLLDIVKRSDDL